MEESRIQPSWCHGRRSYSLLRRRWNPNHAKLRSITQRRGCTAKPTVSSARRTISRSSWGQCSASHSAKASAVYALSAHSLRTLGTSRRPCVSTPRAPGPSARSAGWTCTASRWPQVSTSRWRLRPLTFFPPVEPAGIAPAGPFGALAVDDGGAGPPLPSLPLARFVAQGGLHPLQGAVACPLHEIVVDQAPIGILLGQQAPLAARAQAVEQGVDHRAGVAAPAASASGGLGQQGRQARPLGLGQVGRVAHPSSIARSPINSSTDSQRKPLVSISRSTVMAYLP